MIKYSTVFLAFVSAATLISCQGRQDTSVVASGPTANSARAGTVTEYALHTKYAEPVGIIAGPDGNLWFTESGADKIGRITLAGVMTVYNAPARSQPEGITAGPDDNLWFTEFAASKIGKITPAGVVTSYKLPSSTSGPAEIAVGSDGDLWFTEMNANKIGRMTTSGKLTEYNEQGVVGVTKGPDGNMWFTVGPPPTWGGFGASKIVSMTPAGRLTEIGLPAPNHGYAGPGQNDIYSDSEDLTVGADHRLWFTGNDRDQIDSITASGAVSKYHLQTANSWPSGIVFGPDGKVWFTEFGANKIGSITTGGVVTEYRIPTKNSGPLGIAVGHDGNLWFTEKDADKIGRIVP